MLAGPNGARGRIRTCTGDALDVVSLLLDYASEMDGASCRCCPGLTFLKRKPAGCRKEAKWSQSPVLPWAQRAYETCLSAGSTAIGSNPWLVSSTSSHPAHQKWIGGVVDSWIGGKTRHRRAAAPIIQQSSYPFPHSGGLGRSSYFAFRGSKWYARPVTLRIQALI